MIKKLLFFYTLIFLAAMASIFLFVKIGKNDTKNPLTPQKNINITKVIMAVPYINEAPDGIFTGPWKNACEEANITMLEEYYSGKKSVTINEAKSFMIILFDAEDIIYSSNTNSDATRTAKLINDYTSYGATIKDNPTLQEIKNELQQKRPVISLHRGFDLKNKNIPFLATGSSYHMITIIGYDDVTKEFITNDSGDMIDGKNHRYDYDLFMKSLHDYNYSTRKADGPPRVIFTYPK